MDVTERLQQLQVQLNEQVARRTQLKLALRQASVMVERLEGAVALARELVDANGGPSEREPEA
jgi:chaperonin cofactor prefoldin